MTSYLIDNTVCLYYQEQSLNSQYKNNTENANTLCRRNISFCQTWLQYNLGLLTFILDTHNLRNFL